MLVHSDAVVEYLTVGGEVVETTPEHPFYTREWGWVSAGSLQAGWHVRKADGSYGEVELIEVANQIQVMYNLTVEGAHTFFVSKQQLLVHNICGYTPKSTKWTSSDPGIADLANTIEDHFPGHVQDVNFVRAGTEIDIETVNHIIEYKLQGKGLTDQVKARMSNPLLNPSGKPVIGAARDNMKHTSNSIRAAGGIPFRLKTGQDLADFLNFIKP